MSLYTPAFISKAKGSQFVLGVLHKAVEPDPAHIGLIGAGSIGGKAESARQAINKSNKTLVACAAAEPDGKLQKEQVESILQRVETDISLLLDVARLD